MVEECTHICANGRKCRRIPKRGQALCPAHRPSRRQRRPLEEDSAFNQQMSSWVDRLQAMELATFLSQTQAALSDLQPIIDRRLSRRDREAVRSGQLSPEQLDALCNQMLSILEPNASTSSTLHANR